MNEAIDKAPTLAEMVEMAKSGHVGAAECLIQHLAVALPACEGLEPEVRKWAADAFREYAWGGGEARVIGAEEMKGVSAISAFLCGGEAADECFDELDCGDDWTVAEIESAFETLGEREARQSLDRCFGLVARRGQARKRSKTLVDAMLAANFAEANASGAYGSPADAARAVAEARGCAVSLVERAVASAERA